MAEDIDQLKDEQSDPLIQSITVKNRGWCKALEAMPESYRGSHGVFYRQEGIDRRRSRFVLD